MRLDFFDLQLFLNVMECGSLTKGAAQSAISLQAASERVKKIEQQFQVSLFNRHASGVKLTLAGQSFAEHAQQLMQQSQQLEQAMLPFATGTHSSMTLWCNSSAQSEYLPALLPQYLMENPQLQIELKEAESTDIVHALQQGSAKLGLISSFFDTQNLQSLAFADDPLVLICPIDHPLTHKQSLHLKDTLQYAFVGLMQYHSLQQSIESQAKLLGFPIQYRLRLPNFSAMAQVVSNGVGIAIMPKRAAQRLAPHYAFQQVALFGEWANRQLLLAAKDFDQLPQSYQHFSQFLIQNKAQVL